MSVFKGYPFLKLQEEKDEDEMCFTIALTVLTKRKRTSSTSPRFFTLIGKPRVFLCSMPRRICTAKHVFAMEISRPWRHYNNPPPPYIRCACSDESYDAPIATRDRCVIILSRITLRIRPTPRLNGDTTTKTIQKRFLNLSRITPRIALRIASRSYGDTA